MRIHYLVIFILPFFISIMHSRPQCLNKPNEYYLRGKYALEIAKNEEEFLYAIDQLEKSKQISPQFPDVYIKLGKAYEETLEYDNAIENLKKYRSLLKNTAERGNVTSEIAKIQAKRDLNNKRLKIIEILAGKNWTKFCDNSSLPSKYDFFTIGKQLRITIFTTISWNGGFYNLESVPVKIDNDSIHFNFIQTIQYLFDPCKFKIKEKRKLIEFSLRIKSLKILEGFANIHNSEDVKSASIMVPIKIKRLATQPCKFRD